LHILNAKGAKTQTLTQDWHTATLTTNSLTFSVPKTSAFVVFALPKTQNLERTPPSVLLGRAGENGVNPHAPFSHAITPLTKPQDSAKKLVRTVGA
jgi:hypothetical protein